ncbi:MAG TPA: hypothetical protein VFQ61_04305 [Polyangiaceae bacterium]|nr:hypothetical protein [Polyangiaceae bacterium]
MPCSGLVLTMRDVSSIGELRRALADDSEITFGEACGVRLPLVVETPTLDASRVRHEQLEAWPGVLQADLIHLDQSDLDLIRESEAAPTSTEVQARAGRDS